MIRILMICLCAMVFLFCLYVILIQNFTESKRKTQDRVMGLVGEEERNKSDKKKGKLNLKIKKEIKWYAKRSAKITNDCITEISK